MTLRKQIGCSITSAVFLAVYFENGISCTSSAPTTGNPIQKSSSIRIKRSSANINPVETETQTSQWMPINYQGYTITDQSTDNVANGLHFPQPLTPHFGNGALIGDSRPLIHPEHSFKPIYTAANYRELAFIRVNDNVLGSGNFEVIKGGTYYAEERKDDDFISNKAPHSNIGFSGSDGGYLRYHKNPPPAFHKEGDFFAHFRDFSDITAPIKSAS